MTRVLIINTPGLANKGSEAVVIGAVKCIEKSMPQAEVTFLCHHYQTDKEAFLKTVKGSLKFRVKKHPWYREFGSTPLTAVYSGIRYALYLLYCGLCRLVTIFGLSPKNVFNDCDLIIDLNTDALNEYYQGVFAPNFVLSNILNGIVAGKPVMVCAASIAPFQTRSLRFLVRTILNMTKLVTVRDEFSQKHLQAMGVIKPKIHLTADLAFLLEPCPTKRIDEIMKSENIISSEKPLIGVAVAHKSLFVNQEDYIRLMAESSDALIRQLNATLVFIPNSFKAGPVDDSQTIHQI